MEIRKSYDIITQKHRDMQKSILKSLVVKLPKATVKVKGNV